MTCWRNLVRNCKTSFFQQMKRADHWWWRSSFPAVFIWAWMNQNSLQRWCATFLKFLQNSSPASSPQSSGGRCRQFFRWPGSPAAAQITELLPKQPEYLWAAFRVRLSWVWSHKTWTWLTPRPLACYHELSVEEEEQRRNPTWPRSSHFSQVVYEKHSGLQGQPLFSEATWILLKVRLISPVESCSCSSFTKHWLTFIHRSLVFSFSLPPFSPDWLNFRRAATDSAFTSVYSQAQTSHSGLIYHRFAQSEYRLRNLVLDFGRYRCSALIISLREGFIGSQIYWAANFTQFVFII